MAAQLKESMQLLDRTWLRKTSNSTFAPKPFKYERAGTVTEGNQGLSEAALHGWERNRRQSWCWCISAVNALKLCQQKQCGGHNYGRAVVIRK
jgi:hypothetical protein